MNRCRWSLLGLLLAAATCQSPGDLPVGPGSGPGALALQVLAPALAPVPATSGVARLTGNGVDETRTLTPGQSSSLSVPPGTYTLVLAGLANGGVVSLGERGGIVVQSGAETEASVQLQSFVPDAPVAPAAAVQGQPLAVTWEAVAGASAGYDLEWSPTANFSGGVQRQTTTQRSVSITPAAAGTIYFRVRALTNALSTPGHWSPGSVGTEVEQANPPVITLASDSLRFTAQAGGPSPAFQTVEVTNGGGATLNGLSAVVIGYGSGQPTGWLTAAMERAAAPAGLRLTPNIGGLTPGRFTATVEVRSTVSGVAPATMTVILDVALATDPASIELNVSRRAFVATQGGANPDAQLVQVTNGGGGDLDDLTLTILGSGAPPDGWLTATLDTTSAPATIRLQPDVRGLAVGSYTSTVQVRSPDAANSPQAFVVALSVRRAPAAPPISLSRGSVALTAMQGETSGVETVTVSTGGSGTVGGLTAHVSGPASPWLSATLDRQITPASLSLQASAGTLTPGTYSGVVEVRTPDASNSPRTIAVTLTVTARPPAPDSFTVTVSASPSGGGTVRGGGRFASGEAATVVAEPNPGFTFTGWRGNTSILSTSPSYTFPVLANRILVAEFEEVAPVPDSFTVTVSASPAGGGEVTGGGRFVSGASATVVAAPNTGYTFRRWMEGTTQRSTSANYTFPVTGTRTLVAEFEAVAAACTAPTVSAMGASTGFSRTVTITATVDTGGCPTEVWATVNRNVLPITIFSDTVNLPASPTSATVRPIEIGDLTALAGYTARVFAQNSAGTDSASDTFVTGIAASAPPVAISPAHTVGLANVNGPAPSSVTRIDSRHDGQPSLTSTTPPSGIRAMGELSRRR